MLRWHKNAHNNFFYWSGTTLVLGFYSMPLTRYYVSSTHTDSTKCCPWSTSRTQVSPSSPCQGEHFQGRSNILKMDWWMMLSWHECPTATGSAAFDPSSAPLTDAHSLLGDILLVSSAGFKYHLCPFLSGIPSLYPRPLATLLTSKVLSVSGENCAHHSIHSTVYPVVNSISEAIPAHILDS